MPLNLILYGDFFCGITGALAKVGSASGYLRNSRVKDPTLPILDATTILRKQGSKKEKDHLRQM